MKRKSTTPGKIAVEPIGSTRERIVQAAIHLFYEKGFAATGMAELLAKADANSGSFYHFFESKEDLLLAVLDWYEAGLEPVLLDPVRAQTTDPIERVFALLQGYRDRILMTEFAFGCPIGRLAMEIDPSRREVHRKLAVNFENWAAAVSSFLADAGDRLPPDVDLKKLGQFALTVMEGGVMQSRSHRSIEPFDASVEQLRDYIGRLQVQAKALKKGVSPSPKKKQRKR